MKTFALALDDPKGEPDVADYGRAQIRVEFKKRNLQCPDKINVPALRILLRSIFVIEQPLRRLEYRISKYVSPFAIDFIVYTIILTLFFFSFTVFPSTLLLFLRLRSTHSTIALRSALVSRTTGNVVQKNILNHLLSCPYLSNHFSSFEAAGKRIRRIDRTAEALGRVQRFLVYAKQELSLLMARSQRAIDAKFPGKISDEELDLPNPCNLKKSNFLKILKELNGKNIEDLRELCTEHNVSTNGSIATMRRKLTKSLKCTIHRLLMFRIGSIVFRTHADITETIRIESVSLDGDIVAVVIQSSDVGRIGQPILTTSDSASLTFRNSFTVCRTFSQLLVLKFTVVDIDFLFVYTLVL